MESEDALSDETQPLCDDTDNAPPLRRRRTTTQLGVHFGVRTYRAAVKALRESSLWPLLAFLPLGIASSFAAWNPVLTLLFNLLSIIPLSAVVSNAADLLSAHVGDLFAGLINATFGNTVELSVSIPILLRFPCILTCQTQGGHIGRSSWRDQYRPIDDGWQHAK